VVCCVHSMWSAVFKLQQFDKRLHSLKSLVRVVKLRVVVERGTYCTVFRYYRIMELALDPIQTKSTQSFSVASIHINVCNIKIWLNNAKEKYYCDNLFMQFHQHCLEHLHSLRLKHVNWLRSWDGLLRFVVDLLKLCSRLKASPWTGSYFLLFSPNSLVTVAVIFDIWYIICVVTAWLIQRWNRIVGSSAV
jgi:hypothetical protein